MELDHNRP